VIDGLDLSDAGYRADPYSRYRALRENDPVHWSEPAGAWIVTRFADVRELLVDNRFAHWTETLENAPSPFLRSLARWLWLLHPRSNSRLRELVHPLFTSAAAEALRPEIGRRARVLASRLSSSTDVMTGIAGPLSMFVAARLLGIPDEKAPEFYSVADDVMTDIEALFNGSASSSIARFAECIASIGTRENFLGALAGAEIDSDDILAFVILFLFAAQENIKSFIGNAAVALTRDGSAWRALQNAPSMIPAAIDEILRFDSPVQFVALRAREDVPIHGRRIRAGDSVFAGIAAANRDPETFHDPDRLDFRRTGAAHLSFGAGAFYCIGAAHARVQSQEAIGALVRDFDVPSGVQVEWKSFPLVLRGPRSARIEASRRDEL